MTTIPAPRIFDEFVRTDPRPANGEDSFSFLNRVASPYWQRVRDFIEAAFAEYPRDGAVDLRARFRDRRWPEHVGAWWELYMHALFRAFGFSVEVHPELQGTTARPDFRVGTRDGALLVEARYVAAGLVSSEQRLGRDEWITAPLNDLSHPNFMVSIRIRQRGALQPRRAAVIAGVLKWLDSLDPDALAEQSYAEFPSFEGRAGDWRFELRPIVMSRETRGRRRPLVGLGPASGGYDNTVSAVRRALKEKARRYGRPSDPLVLAVLTTSGFTDTEDIVDALFGSQGVQFDPRRPDDATIVRRRDGFWVAGDGYRGTRISAVLIGDAILPWTVATRLPRLWMHPGAANPMGMQLDLPTARIDDEGKLALAEAEIAPAKRFNLKEEWPGPEPPFARDGISA